MQTQTSPKHQSANGFTVIELMIALAVVSLLFLMIFRALPALIRNGHNNQRKQDVSAILSSVSHYQLSHSGNFPQTGDPDWQTQLTTHTKLTFYETTSVLNTAGTPGDLTDISSVPDEEVHVSNYRICDNTNNVATSKGAGYRAIVAVYMIETGSGTAFKCQDL